MTEIRIAQYGTKHAHAAGKLRAIQQNPHVELAGVFEPDPQRRPGRVGIAPMGTSTGSGARARCWMTPASPPLPPKALTIRASIRLSAVCGPKHVWYDKPAGDNWPQWQNTVALAGEQGLTIQMGYMFRYHAGFRQIGEWAQSGLPG